ncbi:DNA-binding response regulator [Streptococcus pneumoniae]|nr:DNA-binding response regulator [Streptococcus pneumoniae]
MTYTILIVEDEYLVRQGLTKLVNVAAYDMEIIGQAENGRQAWELIQKQVPDIILTDINMPHLNGIQLASLVRETYPQVHLVFLTVKKMFEAVGLQVDKLSRTRFGHLDLTGLRPGESRRLNKKEISQLHTMAVTKK